MTTHLTKMTRTERAASVANRAHVNVLKARREGCSNVIDDMALQSAATELGLSPADWNLRTAWIAVRRDLASDGHLDLLTAPAKVRPDEAGETVADAVSDWRNGPRVIEYATTEEAYDATMSDDTITDGTVLMVRAEGVVGVLMNAWPVAVTAANGYFHHTINPPASGTDPSWDKAMSLAVALGFPLQFAERPALMDRIRSLGERYPVGTAMVDDAGTSAEVTEVSKGMVWMRPDGGDGFIGFDVEHPGSWRTACVVCRPELIAEDVESIAEDVESSAPFRTRSKVKNTRQARRFRKGA